MTIEINHTEFLSLTWASLAALFAVGHNFWLVAKQRQHGKIRIEANTGHHFPGGESAVKPERVADFRAISLETVKPLTNFRVEQNSLVAEIEKFNQSFYAAIELRPHPITLAAEKFAAYIADEDAFDFVAPQFVNHQTTAPQSESYAKFAKVFCCLDKSDDVFGLTVGHKFEIVPQTAFAELDKGKLAVQILFEGKPAANLRVSIGSENSGTLRHRRTDENGLAQFAIGNGGLWFVRTHLIRPRSDLHNFQWESFWASLTFPF